MGKSDEDIFHLNCTECYKESNGCCKMFIDDEKAKYGETDDGFWNVCDDEE